MTSLERLEAIFSLKSPDQTPTLGGWIACPEHIMALAGVNQDEYWADPTGVSIRAYEALQVDGLVQVYVPKNRDDYRCTDHESFSRSDTGMSLEEAVAQVDAMPGPEEMENRHDFEEAYAKRRASLVNMQRRCGSMVWMPANWMAGAHLQWYTTLGYENYFAIIGLYPDRAQKLMEVGGAMGHFQGRMIARAVREGLHPHAVLIGQDICTQRGPMISPDFLERYYAPPLRYGLEPLLEAGCRPVWHCDGDVRPMLDMLIDAGVKGLQGFQPECGMRLEDIVRRRTRDGEPLVIFGPLSVTTELPVCSPDEIRAKVRAAVETCRGKASLALFSANTINPDVPLENIKAMYEAARSP